MIEICEYVQFCEASESNRNTLKTVHVAGIASTQPVTTGLLSKPSVTNYSCTCLEIRSCFDLFAQGYAGL